MPKRLELDSDAYHDLCNVVMYRDKWRCRAPRCGSKSNLHAHHIRFRSEGGPDTAANLVTLCETCHRRVHDLIDGMTIFILARSAPGDTPNANDGLHFRYESVDTKYPN